MLMRINDIDRMFGAMDLFRTRMNRLVSEIDKAYGYEPAWPASEGVPRTNLYDAGEHLELKAEVPGLAKEDLNVKIQGNYLEISGSRKSDKPEGFEVHKAERGSTTFCRSFTLPTEINAEKVEASLKDGILTLRLPKAEAAKPKQITIH